MRGQDGVKGQISLPASRLHSLGLSAAYGIAWQVLLGLSHVLCFLPAGLRLGALWLLPARQWGWIALGEWAGLVAIWMYQGNALFTQTFFFTNLIPLPIYAGVVLLVRGVAGENRLRDSRHMLRLLATGLISAALVSPLLSHFLPADLFAAPGSLEGTFAFLYGDFIGQLMVAPLLMIAVRRDLRERLHTRLWLDIAVQLTLSLAVFSLLRMRSDLAAYVLLLAFAPIFFVAFRQGWVGAAISVSLTGLLIELLGRHGAMPVQVSVLQLALAVVGAGGLLLGAASSELRRSRDGLRQRHEQLQDANQNLVQLANELRQVSQRLVRLEEQGQRELAGELDYELGQAIHALGTHVSLAFREARDEHTLRLLESLREQVREMQDNLRRVLRQLRPQALDSHGLREAVASGPLREMLDDAGIAFEPAFYGRVDDLDDDTRTAVYRICQAAVREATRAESVRRVALRVDVLPGQRDRLRVAIVIDIEVSPFVDFPVEPTPLPAISDRVLAQAGQYQVMALSPGVRHQVAFDEPDSSLL